MYFFKSLRWYLLSGKSRFLVILFFLMALGLITFLISPFLLIWVGWGIAWRVGATGLCATVVLFIGWWFLYNSFYATLDATYEDRIQNGSHRR